MRKLINVVKRSSSTLRLTIVLICLTGLLANTARAQKLGEFGFDTTAASVGRMKIFGIGSSAYFRSWTGPKYELVTRNYLDPQLALKANLAGPTFTGTVTLPSTTSIGSVSSTEIGYIDGLTSNAQSQISGKENSITAGTTGQYWRGDKTWQTLNKAAVGLGNVDNTSDVNKPVSTATQTALDLKANAASPVISGNAEITSLGKLRFRTNYLFGDSRFTEIAETGSGTTNNFVIRRVESNGTTGTADVTIRSGKVGIKTDVPAADLHVTGGIRYTTGSQAEGKIIKSNVAGDMSWVTPESMKIVTVDTAAGRPILKVPTYVGDLIPEDHHIALEPDYIAARSSGNSYFDTLRLDYGYYSLLKDSIELVLPLWDTSDVKGEVYFNVTFHGWDDDSAFYWIPDTSYYKKIYTGGTVVDSVLTKKIESILYFSQPIYYDIYRSNYMSHNHPNYPFRIPLEDNPTLNFTLVYNVNEQKYYLK